VAFSVEDLARTALVRILPRSRYRLAAQTDSRFASFAPNTARIAYRQQGGTPAFLLFSGPGQDPRAAAAAAAAWAEANWRPNAVQRSVRPGVVVVQVARGAELTNAGVVAGTAVPAAVWTVDSENGRVEVAGQPPGSPSAGEVKRAAASLAQGAPAPSLGELDLAERSLLQTRTVAMPRVLGGVLGFVLVIFALRYGFGAVLSLVAFSGLIGASNVPGGMLVVVVGLIANALILVGILVGLGVLFNVRNLALRLPGFSSPAPRTRNLTWAGYVGVMIALVVVLDVVVPGTETSAVTRAQLMHVSATAVDDGTEIAMATGGDLRVDLSAWPSSEWAGVVFRTSNPSVLTLGDVPPLPGAPPMATFTAREAGVSRVDAASADGRYTFQLRVNVIP
jgi:hypothetical protein